MLITLRTLQQHMFKVEIDVNSTVKQLKEKVEEDKGKDYPAGAQKLIYSGKILEDEKKIIDYDIEESKFVVLMVTKNKPQSAKVSESSASQEETASAASSEKPRPATSQGASATPASGTSSKTPETPDADKPEAKSEATGSEKTVSIDDAALAESTAIALAAAIEEPLSVLQSAESALVTGQDYENMVMEIMKLGFDREHVERALRVNFNNPDRAVEFLYNGGGTQEIEAGIMEESPLTGSGNEANVTSSSSPLQSAATTQSTDNPLEFLRNQPQFQQMRRVIQRNPHVLPALLQQIGSTNPPLLQLISQNQETFVQMINEPVDEGGQAGTVQAGQAAGQVAAGLSSTLGSGTTAGGGGGSVGGGGGTTGGGGGGGGGGVGQGVQIGPGTFIQVTPQEKEAIESLKALGFPEGMCIQAYFACEKNEELAANFLLSQNFEDDDQLS